MAKPKKHVLVCVQGRPPGHPRGSCQDKGCAQVWQQFSDAFAARKLWESGLQLTHTSCLGPCHLGASVLVYPEGVMYTGVQPDDVAMLIDQHLLNDTPVERLLAPAEVWA
ncbi:(2Fe-2S) ferredoxin domain-containing protein [Denitromonas iodatirespirans]|uniref:(2Fe-2S) ferredoxin domain-containing protein n=1 Tax=Denitromonas iodatirespirans TaxID=2795389 RepID=A0A944DKR4_DENI1|nr:(2Fe-2S) ferredoxin domain-containing protein [Denitromonas iodatirespirans]MBT0960529.1 (2Fe-2S) ferredoxin domain-containing protein [Denitromonas iodatirespirans]